MVYRLGWTLVHSLWEGAAIAAVLALALLFIPRRAAGVRYLSNLLAMVAVVVAVAVTLVLSPQPAPSLSAMVSEKAVPFFSQSMPPSDVLMQLPRDVAPTLPVLRVSLIQRINEWITATCVPAARFWCAGVMLLGIWRVAAWFSVQRLRALKTAPADPGIVATATRLADCLNLRRPFEILISHFTETPMVIGWLRPVILIPASALTGLSQAQLEAILAHELAHILRNDYLVNLLQIVAETLLFYHPAVWWISRQIRLEREQACDDLAVSLCANRQEYARSLAAIEEIRLVGSMAMAARGSGGQQMLTRVRRILGTTDDAPRWGLPILVGLIVIATAAVGLYSQSKTRHGSTTQPFSLQNDAPRLSPFTAVRWRGDIAEVQYKDTWYELVSINDVSVAKIMDYLTTSNDFAPQKHFAEDLVEVLRDMDNEPGKTVKLELETLDTKQRVTIQDAEMTEENRRSVLKNGNANRPADDLPPAGAVAPPSTAHASAAPLGQEYLSLEAQHKRLADLKNRYDIERIQAEDDVKNKSKELVDLGGESAGDAASPKELEMNRWVQEQVDLRIQKVQVDAALAQFTEKKAKGEILASLTKAVAQDQDIVASKQAIAAMQKQFDDLSDLKDPAAGGLLNRLVRMRQDLAALQSSLTERAAKDYATTLADTRDDLSKRLAQLDDHIANLKAETTRINDLNAALASRREDLASYRKSVVDYDHSLQELDETMRSIQANRTTEPRSQPVPANGEFKFDIPFQQGSTQFLDGDRITVTSVKGTSADMESGICCISGTYTLASHESANLGASVSASEVKDAISPRNSASNLAIQKGTGRFRLLLPISIKGWPHVSFWDNNSSFGQNWIGTGDWVYHN